MGNKGTTMKLFVSMLVLCCLGGSAFTGTEKSLVKEAVGIENVPKFYPSDRKSLFKNEDSAKINVTNDKQKRDEKNNATVKEKRAINKERRNKRTKGKRTGKKKIKQRNGARKQSKKS